MGMLVIVPELITKARGMRTKSAIVKAANGAFTLAALCVWEGTGLQPKRKNVAALCDALGVPYEKISMPIEKVPAESKFFIKGLK